MMMFIFNEYLLLYSSWRYDLVLSKSDYALVKGPVSVCCRESGMKQNAYYIEITSMRALGV